MQQPNDPRLQQAAFRPDWMPLQGPPPSRRPSGWLRALPIIVLAIIGAIVGMVMPSFLFTVATGQDSPFGAAGLLVGMCLGLAAGIWFGLAVTRRR